MQFFGVGAGLHREGGLVSLITVTICLDCVCIVTTVDDILRSKTSRTVYANDIIDDLGALT